MFKVGDKVIVKGWLGDTTYKEGDVGVVTEVNYFVSVQFEHTPQVLLVSKNELEIVEPELTKEQAAGVAGGLQQHSVGDYYPLAAVMYEHNGERIITIENLQTGEVAGMGSPSVYGTFEEAYKTIEFIAGQESWLRTKGRVVNINGRWVLADNPNQVRVTRLRNMLHRGQNTNSSGS